MTLQVAQIKASFKIVEIETAKHNEEQVSKLISEYSMDFYQSHPFEKWIRI
jgi:hypothetical protein